jgi:hypothetical protein
MHKNAGWDSEERKGSEFIAKTTGRAFGNGEGVHPQPA